MKRTINKWVRLLSIPGLSALLLTSCNKDLPEAEPIITTPPGGSSIMETLNDPNYSFLKAAVTRASTAPSATGQLSALLSDKNRVFTFFAPDDNAFKASLTALGLPADIAAINFFRPGQLDTIIKYHLIGGQKYGSAQITPVSPKLNLYLQSSFLLSAPSPTLPPGYRMPIFIGKQGPVLFANNIPVVQPDITVANGIIHKVAFALLPPTQVLWQRIAADADLTYLKAAVERADEGDPAKSLQSALANPAANLNVFAPTNLAFQQLLTGQITLALIAQGMDQATAAATAAMLASTPGVFTNPALASVLTPTTVKGIVVYHIFDNMSNTAVHADTLRPRPGRTFLANFPATATSFRTLLTSADSPTTTYPSVMLSATFGVTGVTAATVKGAANPAPSNILINPTPAPGGTSDQHYINGTLHKIDQVLRPQ